MHVHEAGNIACVGVRVRVRARARVSVKVKVRVRVRYEGCPQTCAQVVERLRGIGHETAIQPDTHKTTQGVSTKHTAGDKTAIKPDTQSHPGVSTKPRYS